MANTIQVFVPVGVVSNAKAQASAAGRARLEFVVGMLDNHKHGSAKILDHLQRRLGLKFGDLRFIRVKKPDAGRGASRQVIEDLAKQCGVVINGVAD
jgi:hypothetical protein